MFINRYRSLDCCTVLSGKGSLQILLLCYIRTDTFLVTEFFLTTRIVMEVCFLGFVILLVKLSDRLTCISLFCLLFFLFLVVGLVLQRGCEYLLLGVDTVLILCPILFLFTVL